MGPPPHPTTPEHGFHRGVWVDGRLWGVHPIGRSSGLWRPAHQLPHPLSLHMGTAQCLCCGQCLPQRAPPTKLLCPGHCLLHEVWQCPLAGGGATVLARGPAGVVGWGRWAGECRGGTGIQWPVWVLDDTLGHRRLYSHRSRCYQVS